MYQLVQVHYEKYQTGDLVIDEIAKKLIEGIHAFSPQGDDNDYLDGDWIGDGKGDFTVSQPFEMVCFDVVDYLYYENIFEMDLNSDAYMVLEDRDTSVFFEFARSNCKYSEFDFFALYEYIDPDKWEVDERGNGKRLEPVEYKLHGVFTLSQIAPFLANTKTLEGDK